ncbi:MAG: YqgE/AlgH family protein [Actinobacteria bacterium]|nr:MAG: YqgE/AlgH family protein [Actinomycetota bacterium]
MSVDSLQGQLLVASPSLLDPNFRRTVVLVTEHGEQGAAGLVLNRPSDAAVQDVVPQLEWLAAPEERIFIGGPVEQNAVLVLAEFEDPDDSPVTVFGDLGFVALDDEDDAAPVRRRRIFAGYAGWGEGQLEEELDRDDWILEPALPDDVFADDADGLWGGVLRRKGGVFQLVARMPEDPSVN